MKRCPKCNRVETDDSLGFCRVDGSTLFDAGSVTSDELGTIRFDAMPNSRELNTTVLPSANTSQDIAHTTAETKVQTETRVQQVKKPVATRRSSSRKLLILLGVLIAA